MKHVRLLIILSLTAFASVATHESAVAGGFQVNELSARSVGMGGTAMASSAEPMSMIFNPAVLSFVDGTRLSIGTTIIVPDNRFTPAGAGASTTKMASQVLFPPSFALSHRFGSSFSVGVSASIPYSLKNDWDPNWVGSRIVTHTEMRTVMVAPAVSIKLSPALSLGIALDILVGKLQLTRRIAYERTVQTPAVTDGTVAFDGTAQASYGVHAGFLFQPHENISIGVSYRSKVRIDVDDAQIAFSDVPADAVSGQYISSRARTAYTTPDEFRAGISIQPFGSVRLALDAQYALWSAFHDETFSYGDSYQYAVHYAYGWKNTFTLRAGLEIGLSDVVLRGGAVFDQSPIPDEFARPSFPDADKTGFTLGLGYRVGDGLVLDFAYMFMKYRDRVVTNSAIPVSTGNYFNGTYVSSSTTLGLTVSYIWNAQHP